MGGMNNPKKTADEKERADIADDELDRRDKGDYFDVPESQVQVNPLHGSHHVEMNNRSSGLNNFEMLNDGGVEEKFEIKPTEFNQVQTGDDRIGTAPPGYSDVTGPVAYRM